MQFSLPMHIDTAMVAVYTWGLSMMTRSCPVYCVPNRLKQNTLPRPKLVAVSCWFVRLKEWPPHWTTKLMKSIYTPRRSLLDTWWILQLKNSFPTACRKSNRVQSIRWGLKTIQLTFFCLGFLTCHSLVEYCGKTAVRYILCKYNMYSSLSEFITSLGYISGR